MSTLRTYTPSPSPPSSPSSPSTSSSGSRRRVAFQEAPSSPPSSEFFGLYGCPPQPASRVWQGSVFPHHPYAGSSKADRPPPLYEKKPITPPITPPKLSPSLRETKASSPEEAPSRSKPLIVNTPPKPLTEDEIWNAAIANAIDLVQPRIDLSLRGLTTIPDEISELGKLVVLPELDDVPPPPPRVSRPFSRIATAPAATTTVRQTLSSTKTSGALKFGSSLNRENGGNIHLYLSNNDISHISPKLFELEKLAVLSLRSNALEEIPPWINRLRNLKELNVGGNQLKWLPSEILDLSLERLLLQPNQFIPCPPQVDAGTTRCLGELTIHARFPSLAELSIRALAQPEESEDECPLKEYYELPTQRGDLPQRYVNTLSLLVSNPFGPGEAEDTDEYISTCPSTLHKIKTFFVEPVVERMEWMNVIAGVELARSLHGGIPVKWRGCSRPCLDFLEEVKGMDDTEDDEDDRFTAGFVAGTATPEFEFSDED
ncbi:hypothetical protein SISNIDRAFT_465404 [Sistotremastrum niveocremeum HHB9708]|uniref:L domain-like protein n=1 Tax=Sistotremastrum niveocremeum HHB9708 TaxID=1314777 RepID=A0A164VVX5_9AGAM|nr:hypothetical protein SISNIDRAFT_465404 [Sistotremastrum niveocremeum HHB9708]